VNDANTFHNCRNAGTIKVIISDCVAGNGGTVDGAAPTVALAIKEGTGNATIAGTTVGGDRPSDL
jgi:hypothetical protein